MKPLTAGVPGRKPSWQLAGAARAKRNRENQGQQRHRYGEGTGRGFLVRGRVAETKNVTQRSRTERTEQTRTLKPFLKASPSTSRSPQGPETWNSFPFCRQLSGPEPSLWLPTALPPPEDLGAHTWMLPVKPPSLEREGCAGLPAPRDV